MGREKYNFTIKRMHKSLTPVNVTVVTEANPENEPEHPPPTKQTHKQTTFVQRCVTLMGMTFKNNLTPR